MSEREEVSNRQVWEYAYITWWYHQKTTISLNYLPIKENKAKNKFVEEGGIFSKSPDFRNIFRTWVVELGQEGYEMIGLSNNSTLIGSRDTEYWFKRPR